MTNDFYTVEQVSEMLDMHHRTIRRYIKEKKLEAQKIGGQWRIHESALKKLMKTSSFTQEAKDYWNMHLDNFIISGNSRIDGKIQSCSIVDFYTDNAEEVIPLSQDLLNLMNQEDTDRKIARFHYIWEPDQKKARFILWGNPAFISKMLLLISKYDN